MRARLKALRGKDVPDLARWVPPEPDDFGVSLVLEVGPLGLRGREEFELLVATPRWLLQRHGRRGLVPGRGLLLAFEWDYPRLRAFLARTVEACTGRDWPEVARRVGRLAAWEGEEAELVALRQAGDAGRARGGPGYTAAMYSLRARSSTSSSQGSGGTS